LLGHSVKQKSKKKNFKKYKKDLAASRFLAYSLGMTFPFPSDSEEYEEYCKVMNAMADEAEASTPDPRPEDFYFEDGPRSYAH
jgi:hypothetical protein